MLVVTTIDGETHKVPVPKIRRKYVVISDTLQSLAWYKVEAYSDELLIGTHSEPAEEVRRLLADDDQADEMVAYEDPPSGVTEREAELLQLMLNAQKVAFEQQGNHQQMILSSVLKILDTMTQRVVSLENSFAQNLTLAQEAAQIVATEAEPSAPQSTALMQQLLPMIMMQLKAPDPKPAAPEKVEAAALAKKKKPGDDEPN